MSYGGVESSAYPDVLVNEVKIPSQVFEIIEELCSRRLKDEENEIKLNNLVKDRVELVNKVDDLNMKIKLLEAESLIKIEELQASNISQSLSKEEALKRQRMITETNEKEIKILRDDLCKFQLTNFALERKSSDQEKKLIQQTLLLDNHSKQKCQYENCLKSFKENRKQLELTITKLESEVNECIRINKVYSDLNKQLTSELQSVKTELQTAESKLTYAKAKSVRFGLMDEVSHNFVESNNSMKEEYVLLKEANKIANERSEELEKELYSMHDLFAKSQCLLEAQTKSNDKCLSRIKELEDNLNICESKCELFSQNIETYKTELEGNATSHQLEIGNMMSEKNNLESKIIQLCADNDELRKIRNDLEDLNSKWASKNLELVNELSAEKILQKNVSDNFCQTNDDDVRKGCLLMMEFSDDCKQTAEASLDSDDCKQTAEAGLDSGVCFDSKTPNIIMEDAETNDVCKSAVSVEDSEVLKDIISCDKNVAGQENTSIKQQCGNISFEDQDIVMVYKKLVQSSFISSTRNVSKMLTSQTDLKRGLATNTASINYVAHKGIGGLELSTSEDGPLPNKLFRMDSMSSISETETVLNHRGMVGHVNSDPRQCY